ncbi:zinc-binding dehydrogenase [Chloroflexi bacterium TSY]|nr:zinc-binding dehydrogenase [Chloroflexi bacterium TSY]
MKAVVYDAPWSMSFQNLPKPDPGPGEVLIDVKAVGICGSDVHGYTGSTGRRTPPMVMGHEFGGMVAGLGEGVSSAQIGDAVVVSPLFPYSGQGARRVLGVMDTPGAYAEHVIVHESMLVPKPADMTYRMAAMCEPLAIAMHAVSLTPIPLMGTVAIIGAGTIGLLTLMSARLAGAGKIIISDMSSHRLEMAEELGADLTINIKEQDPVATVLEFTDNVGVNCAIEAVGITPAVQQAHTMTRVGGDITWIGNSAKMIEVDMQEVVTRELNVRGTYGFASEFNAAIEAIGSGRINVEPLIERVASLEDCPQIMHDLASGDLDLVKVILEP